MRSASGIREAATKRFAQADQARRGWFTAQDVINTRPLAELRKPLKR